MGSSNGLLNISPVDGRYSGQTENLKNYFSEFALIKYRARVEIEYLIKLLDTLDGFSLSSGAIKKIRSIEKTFSVEDAAEIKATEKITNHDVKAVEYFIKEKLKENGLDNILEMVHFGLTSQDVNNTAVPLALKEATLNEIIPQIQAVTSKLENYKELWKGIPMLARTHGQPASPTTLGKEIEVFIQRLDGQLELLSNIPISAKFGGATGNLNAHKVTYPKIDWVEFANSFVNQDLGLVRSHPTTQIEPYDNLAALFDTYSRINTILIDLCRDFWQYISMEYFKQSIKKDEVGSSAMPHKVNPIDFENAEGNLGVANAIFHHLSQKLPISRLQRDLTDSTVLRNIGMPFAHSVVAYKSLIKGLDKIELNRNALEVDLENNWAVVAEAIQNILRRESYPHPYEALKALTRKGEKITKAVIHDFIDSLDVSDEVKKELKHITPFNYIGYY